MISPCFLIIEAILPSWQELWRLENIEWSLVKTVLVVLQWNDHSPRDHQSMENLDEKERDNIVHPEYCRRGQDSGVDNVDGDEKPGHGEERPGHEVVRVLLERDKIPPVPAQGQGSRIKIKNNK